LSIAAKHQTAWQDGDVILSDQAGRDGVRLPVAGVNFSIYQTVHGHGCRWAPPSYHNPENLADCRHLQRLKRTGQSERKCKIVWENLIISRKMRILGTTPVSATNRS
jgi:hypothetical protein